MRFGVDEILSMDEGATVMEVGAGLGRGHDRSKKRWPIRVSGLQRFVRG